MKRLRRDMQLVFQDPYASLNPRLTIEDAVAFSLLVHGTPRGEARERARALLGRVGLDPRLYGRRYPHELSGGQRQRVNIARALVLDPKLLVLDEPVSALDKSVQAQVLNLLQELKAERALTYVFISHDLNVIEYVSGRVLVMYLGQVVETGTADALAESPKHPYTQALFASAPSMDPDRAPGRARRSPAIRRTRSTRPRAAASARAARSRCRAAPTRRPPPIPRGRRITTSPATSTRPRPRLQRRLDADRLRRDPPVDGGAVVASELGDRVVGVGHDGQRVEPREPDRPAPPPPPSWPGSPACPTWRSP